MVQEPEDRRRRRVRDGINLQMRTLDLDRMSTDALDDLLAALIAANTITD